jgi:DNA replication protein DnaC
MKDSTVCEKCSGTGWIPENDENEFNRVVACECKKQIRIERLAKLARIPARYDETTIDIYKPKGESQKAAKIIAAKYVEQYPLRTEGLLFMGTCGVGKTHLAIAILRDLIQRGFSGVFYDFQDLLIQVRESWSAGDIHESEILHPVLTSKVLVIDELGAMKKTDWSIEMLSYVVNYRYNNAKTTIFTCNYLDKARTPGEETLTDRVGKRLRSRLSEMCKNVIINGDDFRREVKNASFQ